MLNLIKLMAIMALATFSINVSAYSITCGEPDREANLEEAESCFFGTGNPDAGDILGYYSGDAWAQLGEQTGDGSNAYFGATSDDGWGNIPNDGDWSITAEFWAMYDEAVISMHIGNAGEAAPDHFAWMVSEGETSGTWWLDYTADCEICNGGGLSNLKLWGRGEGGDVPEPGMIGLLAIGLLGMVVARRRTKV